MRRLAIVLSFLALDACAARVALRGGGDIADLQGCREEEAPCPVGGTDGRVASSLAYGVAAAALGVGVGALVHQIARWRPPVDLRPHGLRPHGLHPHS
jgi:hypothetical protein